MRYAILPALALLALLPALVLAGGKTELYGPQGQFLGYTQVQPGTNRTEVYGPTGAYQGTILTRPDGRQDAYGPTGDYRGEAMPDPAKQGGGS